MKGKVALVTGSSSGIGQAVALRFARAGAKVVVNSRRNVEGGKNVVEKIRRAGGQAEYIRADLSDEEEVKRLFEQTLERFETLDILVNNAGQSKPTPFLEAGKDDWLESFNSNFFTAVLCCKGAAHIMLRKGSGRIINNASVRGLGHTGREGIIAYSAAKAAMINFTKTLAKQLAPGVTVNAVAPGFVETPIYNQTPQELKESFIQSTLIKRWIDVSEIADACLYLAGASAVTGTTLVVDGGFSLKVG